jgi:hypothetical protein
MKRFAALTTLLFALGLLASRTGLVLHEVGGHWGVAASFGCRLREIHLFVFGGGWVDFECAALTTAQSLAIDLGGIALQLAVAAPLLMSSRRWPRSGAGLACSVVGALFVVHGLFYLVTGVHYGVGDGRELHRLLVARRGVFVAAGSAVLVACCGDGAFRLARRLSARVPATRWPVRVTLLAGAMTLAAATHGALTWSEVRLRADRVYAATFQPEHERRVESELRRFEKEAPRTPEQVDVQRHELASLHRVFPLRAVLGVAMAIAAVLGVAVALRPREEGQDLPSCRARDGG